MIKQQMFIGAALIAGVAAGYFMRDGGAAKPAAAEPSAKVERRGKIVEAGDAALVATLRRRVAELESLLAERTAASKASAAEPVAEAKPQEEVRNRWRPPSIEEMKKNDPEGYTRMTNRMARARQWQLRRAQSNLDFLESVDTSGMSASAKRTHQRLQELLVQREELRDDMGNFESLSEEERREHFEKMRGIDHEIRSACADERRNLLGETARSLGLSGEDVSSFSATIEQVIQATESHGMPGMPRGNPPPPPTGGGK